MFTPNLNQPTSKGYRNLKRRIINMIKVVRELKSEIKRSNLKPVVLKGRSGYKQVLSFGGIKVIDQILVGLLQRFRQLGLLEEQEETDLQALEKDFEAEYKGEGKESVVISHLKKEEEHSSYNKSNRGFVKRSLGYLESSIGHLEQMESDEKTRERSLSHLFGIHLSILQSMGMLLNQLINSGCREIQGYITHLYEKAGVNRHTNKAFNHLSRIPGRAFNNFVEQEIPILRSIEELNIKLVQRAKVALFSIIYLEQLVNRERGEEKRVNRGSLIAMRERGKLEQDLQHARLDSSKSSIETLELDEDDMKNKTKRILNRLRSLERTNKKT